MKYISNWQNKDLVCACCGNTKSVKYEYNGKTYCNGCILRVENSELYDDLRMEQQEQM